MNVSFIKWMKFNIMQSKRFFLVSLCGFCVVIPLCLFSMRTGLADVAREVILLLCTTFTVMITIYMFRYLYDQKAASLILPVPVSRRRLYGYHWFGGWLMMMTVALYYMAIYSIEANIIYPAFVFCILFFQNVVYAVTAFFVSRCRRTLDAVLVGFGWLVLTALLYISFDSFVNLRSVYLFKAYEYYGITPESLYYYMDMFSLPHLGLRMTQMMYPYYEYTWNQFLPSMWIALLWWSICAAAMTAWSFWRAPALRGEECGVKTNSYLIYPLFILICILSLMNFLQWNEWLPFFLMIIFLVYSVLYFIYKRCIRFTSHMLAGFAVLTAFELVISVLFVDTRGFGFIEEVKTDRFQTMTIILPIEEYATNISKKNQILLNEVIKEKLIDIDKGGVLSDISIHISIRDKETLAKGQKIQKKLMEEANQQNGSFAFRITYVYNDYEYSQTLNYYGENENMNACLEDVLNLILDRDAVYEMDYSVITLEEGEMVEEYDWDQNAEGGDLYV